MWIQNSYVWKQLSFEWGCLSERSVSRSLIVRQSGDSLLAALCSISPKLPFLCNQKHTDFGDLIFSFFLLFIQQISTSPSVCFTYVYFFYLSILQHKTIITFQAFSIVLAQVSVMVYPPLCFSFLLSYIWYSLHPAIGILLTLACLIRVRQRKRKTKASPFLLPSTCPLPPSSASSFLSPPSHSSVCRITGRYC